MSSSENKVRCHVSCCMRANRQSQQQRPRSPHVQENVHYGLAREAQWASTVIQALTQMTQPDDKTVTKSVVPRISIARAKVPQCGT